MNPHGSRPGDELLRDQDGAILDLRLNRAHARNCLSRQLVLDLHTAIDEASDDDSVHVIVIAAVGDDFCAGYDVAEWCAHGADAGARRIDTLARNDMMLALGASPKATIAAVQGAVEGAGFELVSACDLAIAADDVEFVTGGVDTGDWDHTAQVALSRSISRRHAMELLLTGERFSAADAWRMGLINRLVPATALRDGVRTLATTIANKARDTIQFGKYSYDHQAHMERADAYEFVSDQLLRDAPTPRTEAAAEGEGDAPDHPRR